MTARVRWGAGALLFAAFALRFMFWAVLPLADDGNDSYLQPAYELLDNGRYQSFATLHRLPGAPWLFAAGMAAMGRTLARLTVLQHALGLLMLLLLADAARRAWGTRAGFIAGALALIRLQWPMQECFLLSETLAQVLFAAALWLAVRVRQDDRGPSWYIALGFVCAAATLTRGEFIVLGPLLAGLLVWGRGGRLARSAVLLLAAWAMPIGCWALRNAAVFGYFGLTPDSVTTLVDTAMPLVRYDTPLEAEAKRMLREESVRAETTPGLDPRSVTILRLQNEKGYSYLQAETALGRVATEAALGQPAEYLRLAAPNFARYAAPSRWAEQAARLSWQKEHEAAFPWFWELLRASQRVDWLLLALSALALQFIARGKPGQRWTAIAAAAAWVSLWLLVAVVDRASARIQSELYIPLVLLSAFAVESGLRRAIR